MKQVDLEKKLAKLELEVNKLKSQRYKFKVGDTALYEYRRVKITELVDIPNRHESNYLYKGNIEFGAKNVFFKNEDLEAYDMRDIDYIKKLICMIYHYEEENDKVRI